MAENVWHVIVENEVVDTLVLAPGASGLQFTHPAYPTGLLVRAADHLDGAWGIGWLWDGTAPQPAPEPEPAPHRSLVTSTETIPPDGTTEAVVTFTDPFDVPVPSVTFTVNGVQQLVTIDNGTAELTVVSGTPGLLITVTADSSDDEVTIVTTGGV